ncbi:hypothetical protein D3C85_1572640 [compost metagenome]
MHVIFLELEGHAQLLQDNVIGDWQFDRQRWAALVLATLEYHQAVEEVRHHQVRARRETFLFVFLQVADDVSLADFQAAERDDVDDLGIVDIEHVAHAAQNIVVNHGEHPGR